MAERVVVIDLGSNAVRFVLAGVIPGRSFRLLDEARVQTRLAAGRRGALPVAGVAATVAAVQRFLARVDDGRPLRVVAAATSAVRDAPNAHRLIDRLRRVAGIEVEVLGWEEEARLGAIAALSSLPCRDAVVADLGGGSLQLTTLRDREIMPVASLPLGAVRVTRRFLHHDPPADAEIAALRRHVRDLFHAQRLAPGLAGRLVGLGGTVRTLARVYLRAGHGRRITIHGLSIDRAAVSALCLHLQALPLRRRRRVTGLKADRADIIVAGAVVLEELMALGGFSTLTVCERGVRHGLLIRETFGLEKQA
jgi:exopolyphosphatase/guanosine-5'-triphosphate,3'-diphosphate pyrophosphatase